MRKVGLVTIVSAVLLSLIAIAIYNRRDNSARTPQVPIEGGHSAVSAKRPVQIQPANSNAGGKDEKGGDNSGQINDSLSDLAQRDVYMQEMVRHTPKIEERSLVPAEVPSSATISYRAADEDFRFVEYTKATRANGSKVELVTASINRVVKKYDDGKFDLQRCYFLVAICEEGKDAVINPPGSDSLQLTFSVHPNGKSEIKKVSATDGVATSFSDGGFIEPEFPSYAIKVGDKWEWPQDGVVCKGEVRGFVSLQGRRCIKVKYEATAPIPVKMTSGQTTMTINRKNVSGCVYVDIDNGLQVAHEASGYIDVSNMSLTGYRLLVANQLK